MPATGASSVSGRTTACCEPSSTTAVKRPVVSADDIIRLADAMDINYRVAVFLGALGLRLAEVFGLRVGSINVLRRTITVEATVNEVEGQLVDGRGRTPSPNRTFSAPQELLTSWPPT